MRALHWRQWRSFSALTNWAHSSAMSRVSNDSRISFVGGAARPAAVADALSRMSLVCMCVAAPDHYRSECAPKHLPRKTAAAVAFERARAGL